MLGSLWFSSFSAGGGGAAGDYELISTTVLGSAAASVTFSGLGTSAAAYKHLQIRATARLDNGDYPLGAYYNADTTAANYKSHYLWGYGGSVSSNSITDTTIGNAASSTAPAGYFTPTIVDILDFSNASKNTTSRGLSALYTTQGGVNLSSAVWLNTAAVTSITIKASWGGTGNFVTGSRFSLYGLR